MLPMEYLNRLLGWVDSSSLSAPLRGGGLEKGEEGEDMPDEVTSLRLLFDWVEGNTSRLAINPETSSTESVS